VKYFNDEFQLGAGIMRLEVLLESQGFGSQGKLHFLVAQNGQ